jgi:hypothetical protein
LARIRQRFRPRDAAPAAAPSGRARTARPPAALAQFRKSLPVAAFHDQIVTAVTENQVVVISGETGCGKTTQIPQFILDSSGGAANILITQPRRISAIGVAERVAEERGESVGETAGYQIRLRVRRSAATRLLFCTTGLVLRRLLGDRQLTGVSHLIVDEIHERSVDSDFLLIIVRQLLQRRPDLKVVLMSATLNAQLFAEYFAVDGCRTPPIVEIPGFVHPVEEFYLEDVLEMTCYAPDPRSEFSRKPDKPFRVCSNPSRLPQRWPKPGGAEGPSFSEGFTGRKEVGGVSTTELAEAELDDAEDALLERHWGGMSNVFTSSHRSSRSLLVQHARGDTYNGPRLCEPRVGQGGGGSDLRDPWIQWRGQLCRHSRRNLDFCARARGHHRHL